MPFFSLNITVGVSKILSNNELNFTEMADVESPGVSETPKGKESKFSNRETALIMKTIRDYVSDNNLELSDVCRTLRESKEEEKRTLNRHTVWKVLGELLPHRTVKVCFYHFKYFRLLIMIS